VQHPDHMRVGLHRLQGRQVVQQGSTARQRALMVAAVLISATEKNRGAAGALRQAAAASQPSAA
jgi:hypothetical protein